MTPHQKLADRAELVLDRALTQVDSSEHLAAAMRYATLGGGKRIRAVLAYTAGESLGAPLARLDAVAAALECIHAYSLIHDDLPAMDDDHLRRGQPTTHIKFDEATAILAGDGLQALAFELVNSPSSDLTDAQSRHISLVLARAAGHSGMVGGQMLDMLGTGVDLPRAALENIHQRKTGALISAAVQAGALCADNHDDSHLRALHLYGQKLGLAFQVIDDVLDIEASTEILGKTSGADANLGKATYPALIGLAESKQLAQTLYHEAIASVSAISDNTGLTELAALIVNRGH